MFLDEQNDYYLLYFIYIVIICHKKYRFTQPSCSNHKKYLKLWFNAYIDIILGIKVPHPLMLNVKLNPILLKTGHFKQIL